MHHQPVVICALVALACLAAALPVTAAPPAVGRVILLTEVYPGSSPAVIAGVRRVLVNAGLTCDDVDAGGLAARLADEKGPGAILVLPNSVTFPAPAKQPLLAFLKRGNHLIAVSGPPFQKMAALVDGRWVDRDAMHDRLADLPGQTVVDFGGVDVASWTRATGTAGSTASFAAKPSDAPGRPTALHARIEKLDSWDTLGSPVLKDPFGGRRSITTFWAKGGPKTPELLVEWKETDGTRWMSVVKLSTKWKRFAVRADEMVFWADGAAPGRGAAGDRLRAASADRLTLGLSNGITRQDLGRSHEFWVADVQTAVDPVGDLDLVPPLLETLSPAYKVFPTKAEVVRTEVGRRVLPRAGEVFGAISRSPGLGAAKPPRRFIPVVTAWDKTGKEKRGATGHLLLNLEGPYRGSVWGFLGVGQSVIERSGPSYVGVVADMARRIARGVFLSSAGVEHFAAFDGDPVASVVRVLNLGIQPVQIGISAVVTDELGISTRVVRRRSVPARTVEPFAVDMGPGRPLKPGEYRIAVELRDGSAPTDHVTMPFRVVKPGRADARNTIGTRDGRFVLDGRPWFAFGMNYWPLYSAGQEAGEYWLHWLSPDQYDPVIVERDLAQMQKLGMNLVSIQYGRVDQARPLIDFLARCERHDIKAHIFMPHLNPIGHEPARAQEMIRAARLDDDPAVFAYDLGWEVHVGPYAARKPHDGEWRQWVTDRYGSVEAAEKDWSFTAPRTDGQLTGPADDQLTKDGPWRIFTAAYRRFWDDRFSKGYQTVRRAVREVDPRHLMGARSGWGGLGALWTQGHLPIDLLSGAKHLDFTSPEGYNTGGDRNGFLRGGFLNAYGRHFSGNKPVYWAEFGSALFYGVAPEAYTSARSQENWEREREYYEKTLAMVRETEADGAAGWWWPGGLRVDEKSDFGIINPDGTPRPAAREFAKAAEAFKAPRPVPAAGTFVTVDRDKHATGFSGLYEDAAPKWVDAFLAGKQPGVSTEGTGTTSADAPMVAVGNVPCTGANPPKYLNSEANWIRIDGKETRSGATVEVAAGSPITVEAQFGNTAEAKWLAPKGAGEVPGAVYLEAAWSGGRALLPLTADAPFLSDGTFRATAIETVSGGETEITFRLIAAGRTPFGEVVRLRIRRAGAPSPAAV